jgi:hypothetical protein
MSLFRIELITLACALAAANACAKSTADSSKQDTPVAASGGDASDASDDGSPVLVDCGKVFSPGDAVGILNRPANVSDYTMRPGSCTLETANDGGSIRVYGTDLTAEYSWNDVTKSRDSVKYAPLAGVGERAVWLKSNGTEILAKKGKLYCTVELMGIGQSGSESDFTKSRSEELAKKLGALCNKYFAAT